MAIKRGATFGQSKAAPGKANGGTSLSPKPVSGSWSGAATPPTRRHSNNDVRTGTIGNVSSAKPC